MARLARVVVPGYPHHITQRGNRRLPTFYSDADYEAYLALLAEQCAAHGVRIWAWCLMPNHVHLIAVPEWAEGLAPAVGRAHWRYTRQVNFREGWRGYLWQGRFASCPMDAAHTLAAARYVERNPVRAGLVKRAWQWPWSSAAAHVAGTGDALIAPGGPLAAEVTDWRAFRGPRTTRPRWRRCGVTPARAGRWATRGLSPAWRPTWAGGSAAANPARRRKARDKVCVTGTAQR